MRSFLCSAVLLVLTVTDSAVVAKRVLPSYVKTCSRNDPNLNECALKNGRAVLPRLMKGDPSIRLPVLEPLELERAEIRTSGGRNGLHLTMYKCKVHGLSGGQLNEVKLDLKKERINLRIFIPKLSVIGRYDINGKLMLIPVNGKGNANITLADLDVSAGLNWELIKKKGEDYAKVGKQTVDFTTSRFHLHLTGLFNGDPALNENVNSILNDNWQEVLKDLKPSISDTVGEIIRFTLNNIFDVIPYSQFFPDK